MSSQSTFASRVCRPLDILVDVVHNEISVILQDQVGASLVGRVRVPRIGVRAEQHQVSIALHVEFCATAASVRVPQETAGVVVQHEISIVLHHSTILGISAEKLLALLENFARPQNMSGISSGASLHTGVHVHVLDGLDVQGGVLVAIVDRDARCLGDNGRSVVDREGGGLVVHDRVVVVGKVVGDTALLVEIVLLSLSNILGIDLNVLISVRTTLLMPHANSMSKLVNNGCSAETTRSQTKILISTDHTNVATASSP